MDIAFLATFVANPVVQFLSFLFGIAGVGVSIFSYIRTRQHDSLAYMVEVNSLNKATPSILRMQSLDTRVCLGGREFDHLNEALILIANKGQTTLEPTHFAEFPVRVMSSDRTGEFISIGLLSSDEPQSRFSVKRHASHCDVLFDYMPRGTAVVIYVLHSFQINSLYLDAHLKSRGRTYVTPNLGGTLVPLLCMFLLGGVSFGIASFFVSTNAALIIGVALGTFIVFMNDFFWYRLPIYLKFSNFGPSIRRFRDATGFDQASFLDCDTDLIALPAGDKNKNSLVKNESQKD